MRLLVLVHLLIITTQSSPIREGPLDGLIIGDHVSSSSSDDDESNTKSSEDDDNSGSEASDEDSEPDEKKDEKHYFCQHVASCGTRTDPGPPTADSTLSGYECYCRGEEQIGKASFCHQGTCYDPSRDVYRTPEQLDDEGLCQYTLKKQADVEFCQREEASEQSDPNLQVFSEPPFLLNKEEQQQELDFSLKVGAEEQQ